MLWHVAYVGIGSNLDQPAEQVQRALDALSQLLQTRLVLQSSLYGSKPLGPQPQPDFVNAVAAVLTQLPAAAFFGALRALEGALGREPPRVRWGPRRIGLVAIGCCVSAALIGVFCTRMFGLVVMDHCQDYNLVGKGVMHEGYWSTVLGLPGWPVAA